MLKFVLPGSESGAEVKDFYREMEKNGDSCIGMNGYRDFPQWLEGMRNRHTGRNLPPGYVKEDFYLCYQDGRLVGVFSLKYSLTEYLLNYGGHIGYAVLPSRRGRGTATEMLKQGLKLAAQAGLDRVLCVCDEDNPASEKVIVRNGGVLENILFDSDENVFVKRYWINTANYGDEAGGSL